MIFQNNEEYSPITEGAEFLLIVYVLILIFSWYMFMLLSRKWITKKSKATKWLTLCFLTLSIMMTINTAGFLELVITKYARELYKISLSLVYFLVMPANIFIILFASDIFEKEVKIPFQKGLIVLCISVSILLLLPYNYYGIPDHLIPSEFKYFRIIVQSIMMVLSIFIYIVVYIQSMKSAKSVDEEFGKKGLKFIAYSQLSLIMFFIFLLLDTITWMAIDTIEGYTIFLYLGWLMLCGFLYYSYIGFTMPKWFKNKYKNKI